VSVRHAVHESLQAGAQLPWIRLFVYGFEAVRFRMSHERRTPLRRWIREYVEWRESQTRRVPPLIDRVPWLTFGAIHFLEDFVRRDMRVFEYGSGVSTLFFALRGATVVSIEHDVAWSQQVRRDAAALGLTSATVLEVEPLDDTGTSSTEAADPRSYISSNSEFNGKTFRAYAAAIDKFADGEFHIILIDGRARPSCFSHALPKLAPGGIMILDNSEREHYGYIQRQLNALGWKRHEFAGGGPFNRQFWKTTAWNRPRE